MEVKIKYPKTKCPICGKTFTKTHNRQIYCTPDCSKEAKRRQDTKHRLRWVHKNKERLYTTQLGTRTIGPHKHHDDEREQEIVHKEIERIGLRIF